MSPPPIHAVLVLVVWRPGVWQHEGHDRILRWGGPWSLEVWVWCRLCAGPLGHWGSGLWDGRLSGPGKSRPGLSCVCRGTLLRVQVDRRRGGTPDRGWPWRRRGSAHLCWLWSRHLWNIFPEKFPVPFGCLPGAIDHDCVAIVWPGLEDDPSFVPSFGIVPVLVLDINMVTGDQWM